MSAYNMNYGDDFYSTAANKRGDSRLEFADMSNNQFFNPNAYAQPQQQQTSQQYNDGSASFYSDWATQQNAQMSTSYPMVI